MSQRESSWLGRAVLAVLVGLALGGTTTAWMRMLMWYIGSRELGQLFAGAAVVGGLVGGIGVGAILARWIANRPHVVAACLALAAMLGALVLPRDLEAWSFGPFRQSLAETLGVPSEPMTPWWLAPVGRVIALPLLVGVAAGLAAMRPSPSGADERLRRGMLVLVATGLGVVAGHFAVLLVMRHIGIRGAFDACAAILFGAAVLAFRAGLRVERGAA